MYVLSNGMIANELVRLKITFAVLSLCNTHNLGNIACFNSVCLHITGKVHTACDLNILKGDGLFKVTGIHVHWKSDNISEMVLDRDVVLTDL